MKKNKCLVCGFKIKSIEHNLPTFNHFGFKTVSKKIFFKKCLNCNLVFNARSAKNNFFKEKNYVKKNADHVVYKKKNKVITRKLIISKIIINILKQKRNLKILEIGCSDGSLMKKLDKKLHNTKFCGTEISNFSRRLFPKKKNFSLLIKPNLNRFIKKSYDLIILSHVFNYFNEPKKILMQFNRILKPNGKLFIVLPNLQKNPYYSLMGDQKLILTKNSLTNILNFSGFATRVINNNYLIRELILVAVKKKLKKSNLKKDNLFEKSIKIIKNKKNILLKKKIIKPIIFGTSINSACIDEFTGSKTKLFADEHIKKYVKSFRNKKIIHPKKLNKKHQIIFSFYKNNKLRRKLQEKYPGKYINI